MKNRIIFLFVSIICTFFSAKSQREITVNFHIKEEVTRSKYFKFELFSKTDSVHVFSIVKKDNYFQKVISKSNFSDSIKAIFHYSVDSIHWKAIEHTFYYDTIDLKRTEISLNFVKNEHHIEFLANIDVDQIFKARNLSIDSKFEKKIGEIPLFILVNHSDTSYWGKNEINHFFGSIVQETEFGKHKFTGSFCMSTVYGKSIQKGDTAYSYVPSYSQGNEFKIRYPGAYKYVVEVGLKPFSEGQFSEELHKKALTNRRNRKFYELEKAFVVE